VLRSLAASGQQTAQEAARAAQATANAVESLQTIQQKLEILLPQTAHLEAGPPQPPRQALQSLWQAAGLNVAANTITPSVCKEPPQPCASLHELISTLERLLPVKLLQKQAGACNRDDAGATTHLHLAFGSVFHARITLAPPGSLIPARVEVLPAGKGASSRPPEGSGAERPFLIFDRLTSAAANYAQHFSTSNAERSSGVGDAAMSPLEGVLVWLAWCAVSASEHFMPSD